MFSQRFQKTWSMVKVLILKEHVNDIFVNNINPKLMFIVINYMDFPFSNIIHKLIKK